MKLLFTRSHTIGSLLIRLVTWSNFSHVDIVLEGGSILGAEAGKGVSKGDFDRQVRKASKAVTVEIPVLDLQAAIAFAKSQKGKPYDWLGVAGIGLHRDWQEPSKWSCAEFVAATLAKGGYSPFDAKFHHRITPQDLFMLNFTKVSVK